jgi:hypothetical protein
MIPFLKTKYEASASMPADKITREPDEGADYDVLESAADDLMQALDEGNTKAIAAALRAAFELLDSEPHKEGPHIG